ncbi:MAG TPA: beta-ketoacyl-ACP synthase II [bacterium]|nr:beta-ketoacyl-ACP synthase II [Dictyoglomota bacterium]HOK29088.1 beta-ketoacyl-ACP synthase II [bacterium]HOL54338.1 beta-ketoacyl-ACP synthase II [bacterium]HOP55551.1 beta-ketoacyl-ACP synthase II [bacterium]
MKKRIVITGIGLVTPYGVGKDVFWNGLTSGKNAIDYLSTVDTANLPVKIGGEVKDFDPESLLGKKEARRMDRFTQFAVIAGIEAIKDAGLDFDRVDRERVGVIIGSGIGGIHILEQQHSLLLERGPDRISPFFIPMLISNMASAYLSIMFGLTGISFSVNTACATGATAIGEAVKAIQSGECDIVITGGTDGAITPLSIAGFANMKALSTRNDPESASRPFDAQRDGFVMAEGAGILVIEDLETALSRGANIYAEIAGVGSTSDAYHLTAPEPEGRLQARAMELALIYGGIEKEDVDYINAHGTSTPLNDAVETKAIKTLFGDLAYKIPVSSNKSMIGHTLGAAGGIELIATALTIKEGIIPPTINYEYPDPECDLDYVPDIKREKEVSVALSNSFGFGGHNVSIALKKYYEAKVS